MTNKRVLADNINTVHDPVFAERFTELSKELIVEIASSEDTTPDDVTIWEEREDGVLAMNKEVWDTIVNAPTSNAEIRYVVKRAIRYLEVAFDQIDVEHIGNPSREEIIAKYARLAFDELRTVRFDNGETE